MPATLNRPRVGSRIVVSMRIAVVLPAPFGPRNPSTSPDSTENVMSSTASCSPYRFAMPCASTALPTEKNLLELEIEGYAKGGR